MKEAKKALKQEGVVVEEEEKGDANGTTTTKATERKILTLFSDEVDLEILVYKEKVEPID